MTKAVVLNKTNSIANHFIAEIRDVAIQKDRIRFRRNLERIGEVMAYEISKNLSYKAKDIETPLGHANENLIEDRIVLATILRAGIPFHAGFLNVFDFADNAFVSAYRRHHRDGSFEIHTDYHSCPSLDGSVLVLADPMLATGSSMEVALNSLLENGKPKEIHIATAIASTLGLGHIQRLFPEAHCWIGALDEELTGKSYIVPGLGDAGDLAYGSKKQE
ncbi:MAG: uracil phosphoribosyltransferase [Saprospiraceae bacterium]|nr:uracil phosphoribosyltransferase [Saprospiraceae bacterium]